MSTQSRPTVYTLLTVVFVLLLGMAAILQVAYQRDKRLQDETIELHRNLIRQSGRVDTLRQQLEDCLTKTPASTTPNL